MKLGVIVLQGGSFDVDFEADTTVGVFEQQIEKIMTDLPAERQQLVHRGLVLDNDRLLAEYHEAIAIHKMNENDQEECVAMASSTVRASDFPAQGAATELGAGTSASSGEQDAADNCDSDRKARRAQHFKSIGFSGPSRTRMGWAYTDPSYAKAMCIFYKDDGVCPEERARMHAHDFDVGYWPHGEPGDVRQRRQRFLQKVSRAHDCLVCKDAMLG